MLARVEQAEVDVDSPHAEVDAERRHVLVAEPGDELDPVDAGVRVTCDVDVRRADRAQPSQGSLEASRRDLRGLEGRRLAAERKLEHAAGGVHDELLDLGL
jgi:hypothetical protein